jgi:hypothetical protein
MKHSDQQVPLEHWAFRSYVASQVARILPQTTDGSRSRGGGGTPGEAMGRVRGAGWQSRHRRATLAEACLTAEAAW